MSRTIFVALCAVALFTLAPFAIAEDGGVPPNPVTDAHRELVIGMTSTEWQPIVEKRLGWTSPEKSEYFAEGNTERRVMWTWDAQTKGGPNEPQWRFHLDIIFVEDVIRSTMYFAECTKGAHEEAEVNDPKPTEPENPCLALWGDVKIGMTEEEFQAAATKHDLGGRPVSQNKMGEYAWERSWHHRPPQGAWQWQVILVVIFKDGCVSEAHHIPICYHSEEKK